MTVPKIKFLSAILLVYGLEKPLTYVHAFIVLTCNISVCIKKIPFNAITASLPCSIVLDEDLIEP